MFTGLIEEVGRVTAVDALGGGRRMRIAARTVLDGLRAGDSIAVDGVCLTAVGVDDAGFAVDVVATTLSRTTLGGLAAGAPVNLERALALGERIGGHLVQGHVDAVGVVRLIEPADPHVLLGVELPPIVAEATVLHGSIAIQGVSLTVHALAGHAAQVALIPHTWQHSNLRQLAVGDAVNLEADLIGKHVAAYMRRVGMGGV